MSDDGLGEVGLLPSRARRIVVSGLVSVAAVATAFALLLFVSGVFVGAIPLTFIVALFGSLSWVMKKRTPRLRGALVLAQDSVRVGDHHVARRKNIRHGFVVSDARDGVFVRLERTLLPPIDLAVDDVAHGRRILAAAKLDAARAAAEFRVRAESREAHARRLRATLVQLASIFLFTLAIAVGTGKFFVFAWAIPIFILFALSLAIPAKVTIGTDGMVLRSMGSERFVTFEGVTEVDVIEGEPLMNTVPVLVRLRDAEGRSREEILVDLKQYGPYADEMHAAIMSSADTLAERIGEAIAVRSRSAGELDRRTLARGGRETGAWLAELRAALDAKETFRAAAAPTPEALLRVVEDASAKPVERVAAAIALAAAGDSARSRIRVVAEATAAPQLRIALEAVAREDEVEEALEALENDASAQRAGEDHVDR